MLNSIEIQKFEREGFVAIRGAFSNETANDCMEIIWSKLSERGVDKQDRSTWKHPMVRIYCSTEAPLVKAGKSQVLLDAYNQLLGEDISNKG